MIALQDSLENEVVALEPLAAGHLADLRAHCNDPALWEHTFGSNPFGSDAETRAWLDAADTDPTVVAFAIREKSSGLVVGSTRYLDIHESYRKLEIGWTFVARSHWRTGLNTACKELLLTRAFEQWNALRVQLKAEARNARSREAMLRLGLIYEGTLRNFRIRPRDGSIRDVSFYSVIEGEWPALKAHIATLRLR